MGDRRLIKKKQTKITTYTETYFPNEGKTEEGESSGTNKSWNKNKPLWFQKPYLKRKQSKRKQNCKDVESMGFFFCLNDLVINIDY